MAFDGLHVLSEVLAAVGVDAGGEKICQGMRRPYDGAFAKFDFGADDMNGVRQPSFIYTKLVNGKYERLPFRAGQ